MRITWIFRIRKENNLKIREAIRKILEEIVYQINQFLGYTYWLHIGDLITPCDGNITAGQYFVISRVLDIERMMSGEEPEWQNLITDAILGNERTIKDKMLANQKFKILVDSLNTRGLNPNIAKCSISDDPLVLNNGTHRIGWCILHDPNIYIPCVRDRHDLKPWFPITGDKYFDCILSPEQLMILKNRFYKILMENVRTELTALISFSKKLEFIDILKEYGKVTESCEIEFSNQKFMVFRFRLNKQLLFANKRRICSKYICEIETKLEGYGKIGHTVTESMELENWIEEESGNKLFLSN